MFEILQRLTTKYSRTVDEYSFPRLVKHLLRVIDRGQEDRQLASTGLSILVNLCHRNRCVVQHLVHLANISEFTASFNEEFELLGARMDLILSRYALRQESLHQTNILAMIERQLIAAMLKLSDSSIGHLSSLMEDAYEDIFSKNPTADNECLLSSQPSTEKLAEHLEKAAASKSSIKLETVEQLLRLTDALLSVSSKSLTSRL